MANSKILTDKIGLEQAHKWGIAYEYKYARRHGCNIIEALEDWDLLDEGFCTKYEGYQLSHKQKLLEKIINFISNIFDIRAKKIFR